MQSIYCCTKLRELSQIELSGKNTVLTIHNRHALVYIRGILEVKRNCFDDARSPFTAGYSEIYIKKYIRRQLRSTAIHKTTIQRNFFCSCKKRPCALTYLLLAFLYITTNDNTQHTTPETKSSQVPTPHKYKISRRSKRFFSMIRIFFKSEAPKC